MDLHSLAFNLFRRTLLAILIFSASACGSEPEPIFILERTTSDVAQAKDISNFRPEIKTVLQNLKERGALLVHSENDVVRFVSWIDRDGIVYFYATWKKIPPNEEKLTFFAEFKNARFHPWRAEGPINKMRQDKQPLIKSFVLDPNIPGIASYSSTIGFGVECYEITKPPLQASYISLRVSSLGTNDKNWVTRMEVTLPVSQWKAWEGILTQE